MKTTKMRLLQLTGLLTISVFGLAGFPGCGNDQTQQAPEQPEQTEQQSEQARADATPAATRTVAGDDDGRPGPTGSPTPSTASEAGVVITPDAVHFEELPTGQTRGKDVTIANVGSSPVTLMESRASCGCTAVAFPTGRVLDPGEEVTFEVRMTATQRDGETLNKNVSILMLENGNQRVVRLPVSGVVRSFVVLHPEGELDPEAVPDGRVTLSSIDGQPFRIVRVFPELVESLPENEASEHEVVISWEKWESMRRPRSIRFTLDHPDSVLVTRQIKGGMTARPRDEWDASLTDADRRLIQAVRDGDLNVVQSAIAEGGSLEVGDQTGATPLILAVKHNHMHLLQALLESGADVHRGDEIGKTALMWAAHHGRIDMIDVLMEFGAEVQQFDVIGNTALAWTALVGNAETINHLLKHGAEVNTANQFGLTPLAWAAGYGGPNRVRALLAANPDLEAQDTINEGGRPLILAARHGVAESLRLLVDAGAEIDNTDFLGRTALMWAAHRGTPEKVRILLEGGASVHKVDDQGRTVMTYAELNNNENQNVRLAIIDLIRNALDE